MANINKPLTVQNFDILSMVAILISIKGDTLTEKGTKGKWTDNNALSPNTEDLLLNINDNIKGVV